MRYLLSALAALALSACAPSAEETEIATIVGVQSLAITDEARRDPIDPAHARQWMIDVYYRAQPAEPAPTDVYARDPAILSAMIEGGYYGVDAETLTSWSQIAAPAIEDATPAEGARPVILLSPGSGVAAFNYSRLAVSLVERGYTVVVVQHPYAGLSRLPDGRLLSADDDPVQAIDDPAALTPRILEWSGDLSVTLDRLADTVQLRGLALDLDHVIAVGHSVGGAIALDACAVEDRIDGCMNFEGALFSSRAETDGVPRPAVSTGSRARGRPPTEGLGEEMTAALAQRGNPSVWYVKVTGGSHMSFSDAPTMMPETLTHFGGEIMPPERSDAVYAGMVDAFARAYVTGASGDDGFAAFLAALPEIRFASSSGRRSP